MKTHSQTSKTTNPSVQAKAKNQAPTGSILQAYKKGTAQLASAEEEKEPIQGKFETAQLAAEDEEVEPAPVQRKENKTGLPDHLKSGVENLSGHSLDDVKVHYNSAQPASLQAHAYAQGTDIHVAPGQEKHLPHEAWHVAQQKQGRVKPTMQAEGGIPVNDNAGLEKEADVMGAKATQLKSEEPDENIQLKQLTNSSSPVQKVTIIDSYDQTLKQNYKKQGIKREITAGKKMRAILDPSDPRQGSAPGSGDFDSMYGDLNHNYVDTFIKGHMLNANLGGLGLPENLFPITATANHQHSGRVEENVKSAVLNPKMASNQDDAVIHYTVDTEVKDPNQFVDEPESVLHCTAEKVSKNNKNLKESIVKTSIHSKPESKSHNDNLQGKGWGSVGSGKSSGGNTVFEFTDSKNINHYVSQAGLHFTGTPAKKITVRNGKLNSAIFD